MLLWQSSGPNITTANSNNTDNYTGNWGLAGLLSLFGLLGLKKKDGDYRNHTTTDWMKRGLPSHHQRGRVYFDKEVLNYIRKKNQTV